MCIFQGWMQVTQHLCPAVFMKFLWKIVVQQQYIYYAHWFIKEIKLSMDFSLDNKFGTQYLNEWILCDGVVE